MSTKIYEAWKIPANKLLDFTNYYNNICRNFVYKMILDLMPHIKPEVVQKIAKDCQNEEFKKDPNFDKANRLTWVFMEWMRESKRGMWDIVNFDCSFNAFIDKNCFYIIPYPPYRNFKFKRLPKYCKDFSYWNNTDQPKNISNREWNNRAKTWERIALGGVDQWDESRFDHVVFEAKHPSVGMYALQDRILGKGNKHMIVLRASIKQEEREKEEKIKRELEEKTKIEKVKNDK